MNINTRWYSGMKLKEERESFKQQLLNSQTITDRLKEILQQDLESSVKEMRSNLSFSSPAWSEKQAYSLGQQEAIQAILKLLP